MRAAPAFLTGLLLMSALAGPPAYAQVTTNEGALDSLGPSHPARPAPHRPVRPARTTPSASAHTAPAAPTTSAQPQAPAAKTSKPAIPATPPAILALPPAVAVPLAHPPPPPTVPIADDAPGAAAPLPGGVRVTFGSGRSDFSPATAAALAKFAGTLATPAVVTIFAYAPGSADDPSTPRRLSFERALAVRAALMKAGIASPRIYPRALGPAGGDAPDRADVVIGSGPPPPAGSAG